MKNSICSLGVSFREVLVAINDNDPYGIAFIVDENQKLCGVLSDGDIRRLLIKGLDINQKVTREHLLKTFVYAYQGESMEELIKKTNSKIRVVPIVDKEFRPVSFFKYEHTLNFTPVAEPHLRGKELEYLLDAFESTWISSKGRYIDRFEKDFADYCETKHGVAVSNGTVAIHLALMALDIGPGDEVIVPDLTFAATINTVLHAGATPVIVDIEKDFWTICPEKIEAAITPKTKAIIPVHIYGQPCDMDAIMKIANKHKIYVIEDCAEAHGATFKGKKVGGFGHINCFSFFANKIVTTGEGGMCMTDDDRLAERLRVLRDHGMSKTRRYWHVEVGYNYRMTNLQAAIGCAQLERINQILENKEILESKYRKALEGKVQFQITSDPRRRKVVWMVSCLADNRDKLIQNLSTQNIESRPFFYPLSQMDIYKKYSRQPNEISREISEIGINFPSSLTISDQEIIRVRDICWPS